jgi:ketosteroid isomerase-like protein
MVAFRGKNEVSSVGRWLHESESERRKETEVRLFFAKVLRCPLLGVALAAACVLVLVTTTGCGGKRSTPEKAIKTYFAAVKNKDLDAVLDCSAPDVRELFKEMMEASGKEKTVTQLPGGGKLKKFEIVSSKIKGDWADVVANLTVNGQTAKQTFRLHKIKGQWLFDMPDEQKKQMKTAVEMMRNPGRIRSLMESMRRPVSEEE